MYGHDPQRTSRSPATGPSQPRLLFLRKNVIIQFVGPDSHLYGVLQAVNDPRRYRLAAFLPNGQLLWDHQGGVEGQVVGVAPTGLIYQIDGMKASGYSPRGNRLWRTRTLGLLKGSWPLVTGDSRLHALIVGPHGYSHRLGMNLISQRGKVLGLISIDSGIGTPALGTNGLLYLATANLDDSGQYTLSLQARDVHGVVVWAHNLGSSATPLAGPMVGHDGTVYVGTNDSLLAFTATGQPARQVHVDEPIRAVAERPDGSIVAAGDHRLSLIDQQGDMQWKQLVTRAPASQILGGPTLAVDGAGRVYLGSYDGMVRVISPDGKSTNTLFAGGYHYGEAPSVLLDPKGRLIISGSDEILRVYGQ
jgi:outer membrane protein assembly factor BamB